jgi:hypothetical protein
VTADRARPDGVVLARPDVSVLRTRRGAWVGVGAASFTIAGAAAYEVVSVLLDGSDGSRTRDDLLRAFPAGAHAGASRLLDALVARRCVTVLDEPLAHHVALRGASSAWLIPFLAQLTDEPVRALDRVLATTLHLYGRPRWLERLRALLDAAPLAGLRTGFHAVRPDDGVPRWGDADLVVLDADGLSHGRVVQLQDDLLARGLPHGVVGRVGGRRWVLWSDDRSTGCWDCLHRYAGATASGAAGGPGAPVADDAVLAAVLQAVHRRSAGLGDPATAALSAPADQDLPALRAHPAWAAAGCRCHRAVVPPAGGDGRAGAAGGELVRRNVVSPDDDSGLDEDHKRIVDVLAGWTDEFTGPFRVLDGGDLPQVPFGRARATVVAGPAGACRSHELVAATVSSREALYQAALAGLELIGARPCGPGSVVSAGWTPDEALYRGLLRRALRGPADDTEPVRVPDGRDALHDGCARFSRYVERGVARSRGRTELRWTGTRLPDGVHRVTGRAAGGVVTRGAGTCYPEAVTTALLRLVNDGALVPVNPHHRTWAEVWRCVERPEHADVTAEALPFARPHVRVVEVA